ncbi:MAG: ComF family protein [Paracoccaceae bacterium]
MVLQSVIRAIYPPQCLSCEEQTEEELGLCPACWRETAFIRGLACGSCGQPLMGESDGTVLQCDDCLTIARPWARGVAALRYEGVGRKLVLGLKHADRTDLAPALGLWLARAADAALSPDTMIVPVPLHWRRLLKRRYNQSALLAHAMGRQTGLTVVPDALIRRKATPPLEGRSRTARFETLQDAIAPHPKRGKAMQGKPVLLVDDVMTSGATFAAATEACLAAGALSVCVAALARVGKDT